MGVGLGKAVGQAHNAVLKRRAFDVADPVERRPFARRELADPLHDRGDHVGFCRGEAFALRQFAYSGAYLEREELVGGGGTKHGRGYPWQVMGSAYSARG